MIARKPGDFTAHCRLSEWWPLARLSEDQLAAAEALDRKSVYRKPSFGPQQPCEVIAVTCDETFTEQAAFEAHMAEQHDRKMGTYQGATWRWTRYYPRPVTLVSVRRSMWKPARLSENGAPFVDKDKLTRTCSGCGLVAEVHGGAGELWWTEHERGCALVSASGVAS